MPRNRVSPPPAALPHQQVGAEFLQGRNAAALFDEQGLGKSKQLIDAVVWAIERAEIAGAVIVCPNSLKTTWAEEIEQHCRLSYAVFGSGKKARRQAFRSLRAAFYVINYEAVASELPALRALLRFKRMAMVLDESHRIKTPTASVTRAIHGLRTYATRRYIMTGTPVANKPEDLWSQMYFLDDGLALGETFEAFRTNYVHQGAGYVRLDEVRDRVSAVSLRREKASTLDLPLKRTTRVPVALTGGQLRMYDEMRRDLSLWIRALSGTEFLEAADNVLTRLLRLAQLASNPGLIDAGYEGTPAKFSELDKLLATYLASPDEKAIVWTSFVGNIHALRLRHAQLRPVVLHGEMNSRARDASVRAFKTDPQVRLLIANPAAAREGLTLTQARTAIYVDRTFNLVDYLQSQDRIHRMSQTRSCEIVLLMAEGTIDEFIDFSLEQKRRLARYAQGDTESVSAADLALSKPQVLRALIARRESPSHRK